MRMLPFTSTGSWRVSSIAASVPARSQNNAILPASSAISITPAPIEMIADVGKDLVHDVSTRVRLFLCNHERRVDTDAREIAHQQEAALECFLIDDLHHAAT